MDETAGTGELKLPEKEAESRDDQKRPEDAILVHVGRMTGAVVAGVRLSAGEIAIYAGQQERHAVKTETHAGASGRIDRWERAYRERKAAEAKVAAASTTPPPPRTGYGLAVIPPASHALVGTSIHDLSRTPMEDERRERGLHHKRKEIYERLGTRINLRDGMRLLERWTRPELHRHCRTMRQLSALFPHLTATEVSMLPLLEHLPKTLQVFGTGFESLEVRRRREPTFGKDEDITQGDLQNVPTQLEFRVDGIAYGTDATNLSAVKADPSGDDVNPSDREIVPYDDEVASDIQKLVLLTIELPRAFENLKEKLPDALQVGVGYVRQEALTRVRLRADVPGQIHSTALISVVPGSVETIEVLARALRDLPQGEATTVSEEEQRVADRLLDAHLSHYEGSRMSLQEIVHLLGLLQGIPRCLLGDEPFRGTARFYGSHVLFADEGGTIVEAAALGMEASRVFRASIFDESVDSTERNATMLEIRRHLTAIAQGKIFGAHMNEGQPLGHVACSDIERTALQVFHDTGVSMQVLCDLNLQRPAPIRGDAPRHISGGAEARYDLKMGRDEALQMGAVLERLGSKLLCEVQAVYKRQVFQMNDAMISRGHLSCVEYNPKEKAIIITEPTDFPYSSLNTDARHERSFLIAYGCAEALWHGLAENERRKWEMFYRATAQSGTLRQRLSEAADEAELVVIAGEALEEERGPHRTNCVSGVGMESPRADFCAHFAMYVLAQPDFLAAIGDNRVLRDKYRNIKALVDRLSGEERDFTDGALPASAECGLRNQMPGLPDVFDLAEVVRFMREHEERQERLKGELDEDADDVEEHTGKPLISEADREVKERRRLVRGEIVDVVLGAMENAESPRARKFARRIADILLESGPGQAADDIRDYIGTKRSIQDLIDGNPEEVILAELSKEGFFRRQ